MATIEERVQALEQEIVARKKAEELLTIAVRALVSKEAFEKLQDTVEKLQDTVESKEAFEKLQNTVEKLQDTVEESQEQNGKLFDVINAHNAFTNQQLAELREKVEVQVEGKIVGMQTEMRQRFAEQDSKITGVRATQIEQTALLQQILARLPEKPL